MSFAGMGVLYLLFSFYIGVVVGLFWSRNCLFILFDVESTGGYGGIGNGVVNFD